jgi:hypothetical protein
VQRQAEKLFSFNRACATYLGRLSDSHPERVRRHRTNERNLWDIFPPQSGGVERSLGILHAVQPVLCVPSFNQSASTPPHPDTCHPSCAELRSDHPTPAAGACDLVPCLKQ